MPKGKNSKMRYVLIQKDNGKKIGVFTCIKDIGEQIHVTSVTCYAIMNNKSKKYCRLYKIERI